MKNIFKYSFFISILIISINDLNAQIITEGTYQIYSEIHNEALSSPTDVNQDDSGDSTINNLFATASNISNNYQLFEFIHQGSDIYKIRNVGTNKYLGIKDNWCGNSGEVIAKYEVNDTNVAFLISQDATTGRFIITNEFGTDCVGSNDPKTAFDLSGGASGAKIRTFGGVGDNQQFRLKSVSPLIGNGTYQIFSIVTDESLVSPTNVNQDTSGDSTINNLFTATSDSNSNYQKFEFEHQYTNTNGDVYKIKNLGTNLYVGIRDNWCGDGGEVIANYGINDSNVNFLVSKGSNTGAYIMQIAFTTCNFGSVNSPARSFDIAGGGAGAKIRTFGDTGNNQQFRLISHTWNGTPGSTAWATAANWIPTTLPTSTSNVRIPNTPDQPTISSSITVNDFIGDSGSFIVLNNDLTIEGDFNNLGTFVANSGSSLITKNAVNGQITYNVQIADTNWHLVSSPVVDETYNNDWIANNSIASGNENASNRGISTYTNTTDLDGDWVYFQNNGTETTFRSGTGYSMLRAAIGPYAFVGDLAAETINTTITQTEIGSGTGIFNKWNLIGNPFPSYINIADFLTANGTALTDANEAVYIWNGTTYAEQTTGYIHPGQAFFVNSDMLNTSVNITEAMLSAQTGVPFLKNNNTAITLSIKSENVSKSTKINYLENKTKGLDPRFDVGSFSGSSNGGDNALAIFTQLLDANEGVNFMRQTLPNTGLEEMVVPIGIEAIAGKEITFTAEVQSLPSGINLYLEDRLENKFIRLNEINANYTIVLNDVSKSTGRFYIHTTSSAALNIDTETFTNVSIFKTNHETLRIVGLNQGQANLKLFNILGKQVLDTSFQSNGTKEISLPILAKGIYVVQLETRTGTLNKKIILE